MDDEGAFIMNKSTGERMEAKIKARLLCSTSSTRTASRGRLRWTRGRVHVWPKDQLKDVPILPRKPGLRMRAASGSEMRNHGRKVVKFRGNDFSKEAAQHRVFTRRA